MILKFKKALFILLDSFNHFFKNHMTERSGYIAFLLLLSLFPFAMFLLSFSTFFGNTSAGKEVIDLIYELIPTNILTILEPIINGLNETKKVPFLTFSSLILLYTASSAIQAFKDGFHSTYHYKRSLGDKLIERLKSIFLVLFLCISLTFLSFFGIIFPSAIHFWNQYILSTEIPYLPLLPKISQWISMGVGFLFLQGLYYFLGPKKLSFTAHFKGTFAAFLALIATSYLIPFYISRTAQYHLIYGSLSTIILIILMLQIFSAIILWGAELNAAILRAEHQKLKKHI